MKVCIILVILVFFQSIALAFDELTTPLTPQDKTQLEKKIKDYDILLNSEYGLFPHRGTFILPFTYNATPDQSLYAPNRTDLEDFNNGDYNRNVEAEFQISFLVPIYRKLGHSDWDLVAGYTHHAWWQLYNARWSRPFRETNYTPELFGRYLFKDLPGIGRWRLINFDVGYMHQSNGQIKTQSRSWDRLFIRSTTNVESYTLNLSLWYRIPEKSDNDDNPTIEKYMGIGEIDLSKNFGHHTLAFHSPIAWDYYSLELKYSYPWRDKWRLYTAIRSGYAHSLNDYNHETQRIGVGIILQDFQDK